jgi:hypothetical protein
MQNSREKQKESDFIGYIGIVDFLTQQNIDNNSIRNTLNNISDNQEDYVSDFVNNKEISTYLLGGNEPSESIITQFGFVNLEEFNQEKLRLESLGCNWKNPLDVRKMLGSYFDSYKAINTLANQQHTGSRVTSTSKELIQNAIDTTVQAINPNIPPIGKFGMGAKTMLGLLKSKGEYILYNSKLNGENKVLLIYQTGTKLEEIIISESQEFIKNKIKDLNLRENQGTDVILSLESSNEENTTKNAIEAFQYNPNVSIKGKVEGSIVSTFNQTKNTDGEINIHVDGPKIVIQDEGKGFDPIAIFSTSTKNSSERNLKQFNQDSKAFIDPQSKHHITMLLQDTVLTYENIDNDQLELYNPDSLINGIVIDNKSYLNTSETRSNWLIGQDTIPSLEFAISNLIDNTENQEKIINTIYLWISNIDKAKKPQLQPIINLLKNKVKR